MKTNNVNNNKTFLSAGIIAIGVLLSRLTGLIRDVIFASFLGTGIVAEAFYVAFRLPNTFRRIFAEGAFSNSFVPFFSSKVKENKTLANDFSAKILIILLLSLSILTLIIEIFMPSVIKIINPGFINNAEKYNLAILLSRIAFPYVILISLTAFFGAILNSIGSFWQFSIVSVILNITFIVGLFLTNNLFSNTGLCLSYLTIIAGFLQLVFVVFFCIKKKIIPHNDSNKNITIRNRNNHDVKKFIKKLIPAIISSGVLQINILIDGIFASFFTSAVAYLYYTDRIGQFPLSIIGYSISIAILPSLSIAFKEEQQKNIAILQRKAFNVAIFFSIPAMICICIFAKPIVALIYHRGAFTEQDVKIVASMLFIYATSIPFNVLLKIFFAYFYANKNTIVPMKISFISLIFNIICNAILIHFVKYYCVIISTTSSAILSCILTCFLLKRDKVLYLNKQNILYLLKISIITFLSVIPNIFLSQKIHIILIIIIIGFIYLSLCLLTKTFTIKDIKNSIK